jgi:hypothetical protein
VSGRLDAKFGRNSCPSAGEFLLLRGRGFRFLSSATIHPLERHYYALATFFLGCCCRGVSALFRFSSIPLWLSHALRLVHDFHEYSALRFGSPKSAARCAAIAKRIYLYGNWGAMEDRKRGENGNMNKNKRRRRRRRSWRTQRNIYDRKREKRSLVERARSCI